MESMSIVGMDSLAKAFSMGLFVDIETGHLAMMDWDSKVKLIKTELFRTIDS
jgi:hypothetical protein